MVTAVEERLRAVHNIEQVQAAHKLEQVQAALEELVKVTGEIVEDIRAGSYRAGELGARVHELYQRALTL